MSKLALTRMQISQIAMNTADNMSRVGLDSGLSLVQIREVDVNDSFAGAKIASGELAVTTNGRIILSSLETNSSGGQWIHWQRCKGAKVVNSAYGAQGTGITGTSFAGMGPATARVTAPAGAAVMYVEIYYDYQPLFPMLWSTTPNGKTLGKVFNSAQQSISYGNAFIVRDNRDLTQIYNPNNPLTGAPAPVSNCNTYSS